MMNRIRPILGLCLLSLVTLTACRRPTQTRLLVRLEPAAWTLENFVSSKDLSRSAWLARIGDSIWYVVVDGRPGPGYDAVRSGDPVFSDDGRAIGYVAKAGGRIFAVVNGKEGPRYDDVGVGRLLSPDGTRVAYAVRKETQALVVNNGIEGPVFEGIGTVIHSPDSRHIAYPGRRGKNWYVVLDSTMTGPFDAVTSGSLQFSPDGSRFAFIANAQGRTAVVLDGHPLGWYRAVSWFRFSPDSRRFAYAATNDTKWRVYCDNDPGPETDGIGNDIVFSPDSRRLAYGACFDTLWAVLLDHKPIRIVRDIGDDSTIVFSPDSRHLAHFFRSGDTTGLLLDGEPAGTDCFVRYPPVFSPDSRRLAYVTRSRPFCHVVIDGIADTFLLNGVEPHTLVFSPTSQHYAYCGWRGIDWYVVLDGHPSRPYREPPRGGSRLRFRSDSEVEYIAVAGDSILLVRATVPRPD